MKKYVSTEFLDELRENGQLIATPSRFDHDQPVYLASEADAEIADMRAGFEVELASKDEHILDLERRIAELEVTRDALMVCANKQGDRISDLKKAIDYWMPDETLVKPEHKATWDRHIDLMQRRL